MKKRCFKCGLVKSIDDFYSYWCSKRKKTRILRQCKSCAKKYRPGHYKYVKQSCARYPKKARNRALVAKLIRTGEIVRPSVCSSCATKEKIYAHHPDHRKPRLIQWLCSKCHVISHRMTS